MDQPDFDRADLPEMANYLAVWLLGMRDWCHLPRTRLDCGPGYAERPYQDDEVREVRGTSVDGSH